MEFNSRLGDPEALNVLALLTGSFSDVIKALWHGDLAARRLDFAPQASVVKYLVAKEYPAPSPMVTEFFVNQPALVQAGIKIYFSHAEKSLTGYQTLKCSRVAALVARGNNVQELSRRLNNAIQGQITPGLEFREDIGEDLFAG